MSQKPQQANTSDVIQARYDKLDALRAAGRDPFVITTSDRDSYTADIKNSFEESLTLFFILTLLFRIGNRVFRLSFSRLAK